MSRSGDGMIRLDRRGMTLIELIVASTIALILLAGAVPLFLANRRGVEQTMAVRVVQTEVHVTVERLLRVIRNADAVDESSTGSRLVLQGGEADAFCGAPACWIEVTEAGLHYGPEGGGAARLLAAGVTGMVLTFGLDDNDDGRVDQGVATIPSGRSDDVLAVRLRLRFEAEEARGSFELDLDFVGALRTPILDRVTL